MSLFVSNKWALLTAKLLQDYLSQAPELALSRLQTKPRKGTEVRDQVPRANPALLPRWKPPRRNWVSLWKDSRPPSLWGRASMVDSRGFHGALRDIFKNRGPWFPPKPSCGPDPWQSRVGFGGNLGWLELRSSFHWTSKMVHVPFPTFLYFFYFYNFCL